MSRPSKFGKSRQSFDSETSNFTTPPLSPRSSQLVGSQLVSYYPGGAYGGNVVHGNPAYYIESPSRNSFSFNDLGELSQSFAANSTPSGSQLASPLHHSFASIPHQQQPHQYLNQQQHQLNQQQHQAVYGNPRPGSRRVLPQPHNVGNVAAGGVPTVHKKGYQPWNGGTIQEEEEQRPLGSSGGRGVSRWCAFFLSVFVAALCIVIVGLIYWLLCHPSAPRVQVKNINFQAFSVNEGSDSTGVATQVLTANVITTLSFGNPSKYFGFHVSAPYITLSYQEIVIAQGETEKFFQKKKSTGAIVVDVTSTRAPIYGAGPDLLGAVSSSEGLPLQLQIRVQSEARVIWEIVQPRYRSNIECDLVLNPTTLKLLSQNCHRG